MLARRATLVLAFAAFVAALSGSALAQGLSPITDQMESLFAIVLLLAILVGLVVYGTLAIALIRFRHTRSAGTSNPSLGNRRLEAVWSAVPALLLVGVTILSTQTLVFIETNPKNVPVIHVLAQQWSWQFTYPDRRTSSELWIQRGVTFLFNITSKDVIHSFYLPDFQVKKDAVPGMYNFLWLRADRAGRYYTQCAEYCGLGHSAMIADVIVFEPEAARPPYGPPPEGPPIPRAVDLSLEEVSATSSRVVPATLNLTVNEYVRIRVWNNGTVDHTFAIDAPYNVSTGAIPPGSFRVLFLNATQPTNGTAYGADAADRAKGMVGTLAVGGGEVIDVELHEFFIVPSDLHLDFGKTYTLRIRNVGPQLLHNFSIGAPYNLDAGSPWNPGETRTLTFVADKEARTQYICAVAGHAGAGMVGTLVVGNPPQATQQAVYPLFEFALATSFIVGIAGFGYVVHHALEGRRRPGPGTPPGRRE